LGSGVDARYAFGVLVDEVDGAEPLAENQGFPGYSHVSLHSSWFFGLEGCRVGDSMVETCTDEMPRWLSKDISNRDIVKLGLNFLCESQKEPLEVSQVS
jgi:hypothetical protein